MKIAALLLATAIAGNTSLCTEGRPAPVLPLPSGGGGGGGAVAPAQPMPMAPPPAEDPYANYETHGVVSPENCQKMARRFKQEGRGVRLIKVVRNPYNQGGVLKWMCVFDGDPEATPFEDDRFPQDNYTYP